MLVEPLARDHTDNAHILRKQLTPVASRGSAAGDTLASVRTVSLDCAAMKMFKAGTVPNEHRDIMKAVEKSAALSENDFIAAFGDAKDDPMLPRVKTLRKNAIALYAAIRTLEREVAQVRDGTRESRDVPEIEGGVGDDSLIEEVNEEFEAAAFGKMKPALRNALPYHLDLNRKLLVPYNLLRTELQQSRSYLEAKIDKLEARVPKKIEEMRAELQRVQHDVTAATPAGIICRQGKLETRTQYEIDEVAAVVDRLALRYGVTLPTASLSKTARYKDAKPADCDERRSEIEALHNRVAALRSARTELSALNRRIEGAFTDARMNPSSQVAEPWYRKLFICG